MFAEDRQHEEITAVGYKAETHGGWGVGSHGNTQASCASICKKEEEEEEKKKIKLKASTKQIVKSSAVVILKITNLFMQKKADAALPSFTLKLPTLGLRSKGKVHAEAPECRTDTKIQFHFTPK